MRAVLLFAVFVALLAATAVFAYYGLAGPEEVALGVHGWTAMIIGVIFSILVGVGLMGLMFFSSRHGYDEPPQVRKDR
ncbi:signal peptide protein [Afipia sp. P52-10]|jgi:hypothetical protein|uniref:hypothetical protein n=1 Tax=Afipia sp. P52-10 TaxID=1429916 RepID=UPI0003DEF5B2|nr:hypothetical protein [Afipia sp. P52-10]ETR76369.1 signal peptide protein [Afipia sp. P52-10]